MYPDPMTVDSETCEHQTYHWNVYVFQGIKARQMVCMHGQIFVLVCPYTKKNTLSLSVNIFGMKVQILMEDTIFTSPSSNLKMGPSFFVVIRVTRRSNHLHGKSSSLISW